MSGKTLAWATGAAGVAAVVIGVVTGTTTSPAAVRPGQGAVTPQSSLDAPSATAVSQPPPAKSCDALARVIEPRVPYDTLYDAEASTITVYGHGAKFTVDLTDDTCRASSPLIDALARDALLTWRQTSRSECASTRKQIEAAGDAEYVVGHGVEQVAVDALRAYAEEICAAARN
jgi:hypothetical protein